MSSHHRHASESPFKWRFTGGPMMARLYSGIWILPSKKRCQVGFPLATLSGSAHVLYIMRQSFVTTASPQPLSRTGISIAWFLLFHCPHNVEEMLWFDRHRQTWQCSIIADCGDELLWFCQLAVPTVWFYYGELQTQSQSPRQASGLGRGHK